MVELWMACKVSGSHEVSNFGRVRQSPNRHSGTGRCPGKLMTLAMNHHGYLRVGIRINGKVKWQQVHRLVAEAFIGERPLGMQVNHKDGNKTNNRADNLEYVTAKENTKHAFEMQLRGIGEHHPRAMLNDMTAIEILRLKGTMTQRAAAKRYGCTQTTVWSIWGQKGRFANLEVT